MKRAITIDCICYAIILLFVYAALSKLFLYSVYVGDLKRSPFIAPYASYLSLTLPILELAISALLIVERTRLIALWGAFILMLLFTGYVALIIGVVNGKPCTCGGLIRKLSWGQHLALNIFYTILSITGIWLQKAQAAAWQRN
jgi:hypothetical protein